MIILYSFRELNVDKNELSEEIGIVVNKLRGVPYKHNGRSFSGVDCWGLIYLFFRELGIELPTDDGEYISQEWYKNNPERYINSLKKYGKEVGDFRNLKPLDIPYYNLYKDVITHTSVMIDNTYFLHVLIDKKVDIGTMDRRLWRKKYKGARRIIK